MKKYYPLSFLLKALKLFNHTQLKHFNFCFLLLAFLVPTSAWSQSTLYLEEWYESTGSTNDLANQSVTVNDSQQNYYVATSTLNGTTTSTPNSIEYNYDLLLTKYDEKGNQIWSETFNIGTQSTFLGDMKLDGNENPIVVGFGFNDNTNSYDGYVVKFNTSGVEQWNQTFDGSANADDGAKQLAIDNNEIYLVGEVMTTNNQMDFITKKYSSSGVNLWSQTYDYSGLDDVAGLVRITNGKVDVTGIVTIGGGNYEQGIIHYNSTTGVELETATTSGLAVEIQKVNDVLLDANGNIYITGGVLTSSGFDYKTIKLDTDLNILWTQSYNSVSNDEDIAKALTLDGNGNVYVTGYATINSERKTTTIKYSNSGTQIWATTYSSLGSHEGNAIDINTNDEVFVAGYLKEIGSPNKDFHLTQYSTDGVEMWKTSFNGIYNKDDDASEISIDLEGNVFVSGKSKISDGINSLLTVKYNKAHLIIPPDDESVSSAFNYIENKGQLLKTDNSIAEEVVFYTSDQAASLYFQNDLISMVLAKVDTISTTQDTLHRVDMIFNDRVDVRSRLRVSPLDTRTDYFNYYLGHIQEGREEVRLFDKLVYPQIYNGIDALYSSNGAGMKYYFVCHPNADPSELELTFEGQNNLNIVNGDLIISTSVGKIILPQPKAYKIENGQMVEYAWSPSYSINGSVVSISNGSYDSNLPLVIVSNKGTNTPPSGNGNNDWSTYYGGDPSTGEDYTDIVSDLNSVYVTGHTQSIDFPTTSGAQQLMNAGNADAFLIGFEETGVRRFATYHGGSGIESSFGVEIGNPLEVYIVGSTRSLDFPLLDNGIAYHDDTNAGVVVSQDAFISKFSNNGTLVFATFYGEDIDEFGDPGVNFDIAYDIKKDPSGNIFIAGTGRCKITNNPIAQLENQSGLGFIAKFDNEFKEVWATQLGAEDEGTAIRAIDFDSDRSIFFIGNTIEDSENITVTQPLPTSYGRTYNGGDVDIILGKINPDIYFLDWLTYFGGNSEEFGYGLKVDNSNNVYICGNTESTDIEVLDLDNSSGSDLYNGTALGQQDCVLGKFDNDGIQLWTTYFGGSGATDFAYDVETDNFGNIYFVGASTDLINPPQEYLDYYYQEDLGNSNFPNGADGYVLMVNSQIEPEWITYYGGESVDIIQAASFSPFDRLYITGISAQSDNFPWADLGSESYYEETFVNSSGFGGFIARFLLEPLATSQNELIGKKEALINVIPNPSNGNVVIKVDADLQNHSQLLIYDILGQKIFETTLNNTTKILELNLLNLVSGIYTVSVIDHNSNIVAVEKIFISK